MIKPFATNSDNKLKLKNDVENIIKIHFYNISALRLFDSINRDSPKSMWVVVIDFFPQHKLNDRCLV